MEMDNGNSVDHYTKYNEGWSFAGDSSQRFRNKRRERSKRSFLSFQQMLLQKDHKSSSVLSDIGQDIPVLMEQRMPFHV